MNKEIIFLLKKSLFFKNCFIEDLKLIYFLFKIFGIVDIYVDLFFKIFF